MKIDDLTRLCFQNCTKDRLCWKNRSKDLGLVIHSDAVCDHSTHIFSIPWAPSTVACWILKTNNFCYFPSFSDWFPSFCDFPSFSDFLLEKVWCSWTLQYFFIKYSYYSVLIGSFLLLFLCFRNHLKRWRDDGW